MTDSPSAAPPPSLDRLVQSHTNGEFDDPVRSRLLHSALAEDPLAAALRYVRSMLDNPDLRFLLGQHASGEIRTEDLHEAVRIYRKDVTGDPIRKDLRRISLADDPATAAFRHVKATIDNSDLTFLLGQYASGEIRSDDLHDAVQVYRKSMRADPTRKEFLRMSLAADPTAAAFQHVKASIENADLRYLLSQYASGDLRIDDLNDAMRVYRKDVAGDPARKDFLRMSLGPDPSETILQHVKGTIDNANLRYLLSQYTAGALRSERLQFLTRMYQGETYAEDLLATRATADFLDEPDFARAYQAGAEVSAWGHPIRWRVYTLIKSAKLAANLDGDFVECGVDRGGTALCVLESLGAAAFQERLFYLFDTFDGLVDSQQTVSEKDLRGRSVGRFPDVFDEVRDRFAPHDFVELVRGAVPDTLPKFTPGPVAYLHIDMNVAIPEREAFKFFWPFLVSGAPVIFDDYGFPHHRDQRDALDRVAEELGTQIMMLPTGQGLCWKT